MKTDTVEDLGRLMDRYRLHEAVVDPGELRSVVQGYVGGENFGIEGYDSPDSQRDQSVTFYWGHDHDFGDFKLEGAMGSRHVTVLANMIDRLGLPRYLEGQSVMDIGCWTGGMSLVLHAMGGEVVAIEEVHKYAEAASYLFDSFDTGIEVHGCSLYDLGAPQAFDYVIAAGVLYHVTDPVVALRTMFNQLRDGGRLFIETAGCDSVRPMVRYDGPSIFVGTSGKFGRRGWNWFMPSPSALRQMMRDVGFQEARVVYIDGRVYAVGRKDRWVDMLRAGLSRDVR